MTGIQQSSRALCSGFLTSAKRFAERPALVVDNESISYHKLFDQAASIAATLQQNSSASDGRLTGVFGHRSLAAFSGLLGVLMKGDGYVPLNPMFPSDRVQSMVSRAKLKWIVAEAGSLAALEKLLALHESELNILIPDCDELEGLDERLPRHKFFTRRDLAPADSWLTPTVDVDAPAYLLFTSGSTGQPKGVMVSHSNVTHFVDAMVARYAISENDRFSQTFDLTFDLSAFDLFVAWEKGACVCCPTQQEKLFPAKYINSQQISIWFSVPSTGVLMKKLRMLKPDKFPGIRYSLFCGEALPLEVAEAFQQAASSSIVENLYGPTELTIACTLYTYDAVKTPLESKHGIVPIGDAYPNMKILIVDEDLQPVDPGQAGELLMAGPQLSLGYWEDPGKTSAAFVQPPGVNETYYKTGDRVVRQEPGAPLLYLGRVDNQIKVQGYRVELGEIEAIIREQAETDVAVALGYPVSDTGAEGVVAFVSKAGCDLDSLRNKVQQKLPAYMQPSDIFQVEAFPLNANGKVDRKALLEILTNRS